MAPATTDLRNPDELTDVSLDELEHDPYPFFERLRTAAPVAYVPVLDEWLITRWQDCADVGAFTDTEHLHPGHPVDDEFFGSPNILRMEGAPHVALRAAVDGRLRPAAVKRFVDAATRPVAVDYIERLRRRPEREADLVSDLFERISVRVVGTTLGLGDLDDETLVRWFQTLSGGHTNRDGDDAAAAEAERSLREIDEHLRRLIAHLQRKPDDSIISAMIHRGLPDGAAPRGFDGLVPTIKVIVLGGFQEPGNAMANAVHGLMSSGQWADLVADRSLVGPALHEGLRWIAPIGSVARTTARPLEVGGVTIPVGAKIQLVTASANRDPERFPDGERYDLHRPPQGNATFGYGSHFCAGHFLARQVGQIVLEELSRRIPALRPHPDEPPKVSGFLFRGVKSLPVVWSS